MSTRITLAQGVATRVRLQRGDSLVCRQGTLWLSSAGEDIVLAAGQRYLASTSETLVIEALPAGSCVLERSGLAGGLLRLLEPVRNLSRAALSGAKSSAKTGVYWSK